MTSTIEDGHLVLRLKLVPPTPSKSGKSLLVAKVEYFTETTVTVEGKPVIVSASAFVGI